MSRIDLQFVGTVTHALSVAPEEFRGLPVTRITGELTKLLSDIAPHVNFFPLDIELAADEVARAI